MWSGIFTALRLFARCLDPLDPRQSEAHTAGDDWNADRWPDGTIAGVQKRYRLAENVGPYFLFGPKQAVGIKPLTPKDYDPFERLVRSRSANPAR